MHGVEYIVCQDRIHLRNADCGLRTTDQEWMNGFRSVIGLNCFFTHS